eukprot:RCo025729
MHRRTNRLPPLAQAGQLLSAVDLDFVRAEKLPVVFDELARVAVRVHPQEDQLRLLLSVVTLRKHLYPAWDTETMSFQDWEACQGVVAYLEELAPYLAPV